MTKVILYLATSSDGFIANKQGSVYGLMSIIMEPRIADFMTFMIASMLLRLVTTRINKYLPLVLGPTQVKKVIYFLAGTH